MVISGTVVLHRGGTCAGCKLAAAAAAAPGSVDACCLARIACTRGTCSVSGQPSRMSSNALFSPSV